MPRTYEQLERDYHRVLRELGDLRRAQAQGEVEVEVEKMLREALDVRMSVNEKIVPLGVLEIERIIDALRAKSMGGSSGLAESLTANVRAGEPPAQQAQPVGLEPRGCPTPGACSCVTSQPPLVWVRMLKGKVDWDSETCFSDSPRELYLDDYDEADRAQAVPLFAVPPQDEAVALLREAYNELIVDPEQDEATRAVGDALVERIRAFLKDRT